MKRFTIFPCLLLLAILLVACGNSVTLNVSQSGSNTPTTIQSQAKTTPTIMGNGTFREYSLPLSNSGLMRPAIDHQGRIWFGEMGHNLLAVFDPRTQQFQQITPPAGRSGIMGLAVAADDTIWFAEQYADYIGHYFPATGHFQTYPLPTLTVADPSAPGKTLTIPSAPNDLVLDQRSNVWFTELNANAIGQLNIQNGQIQQFSLTNAKTAQALNPYGITIDPQGKIWFTEASTNQIGQLDPKTGQISYVSIQGSPASLMEIASDRKGTIWVTSFSSGLLLHYNPKTASFTRYYATTSGGIYGVCITPEDQVWVTLSAANAVAHLDPAGNRFTEYVIPSSASLPLGVVSGTNNALWFTEAGSNKIGTLNP
jgi:streptogramin lyase